MFRTANDFIALMDREFASLTHRAKYYRALASLLRARVHFMKSQAARDEVLALASTYDGLSEQLESSRAPASGRSS
jgi:hypothetical protein